MSDKRLHTDLATSIKSRIDQLIRRTGYRIVRTDDLPDIGAPTARTIATVRAYTALSPERIVAVIDATKYLERYDIQGAIVECGVWRGGAMMAAARTLLEIGSEPRDIYLFDTFEGMTEPTEFDRDLNGVPAAEQIESVKMAVPIEEVRRNIESTPSSRQRPRRADGS
jgi:O-methyltransferase